MFVYLTKRTKFLVRVHLFNKPTDTNELPAEWFTNCSPNVWFICRVKVPTGILGAEIDKMSPPELVKEFEAALVAKEYHIITLKKDIQIPPYMVFFTRMQVNSFVKIYPGVSHGWTIRYKDEDAAEVKCAQEAHQDLVEWFGKCL
ncbi:putative alpha/Beta hydrolase [Helianthus annuus]|nr:putative alpha/Beta hydrolase [Helianthus annuus]